MIYTKSNDRKIPVLDDNTFSVCCRCGKEVPVHLSELLKAKIERPLSARIMCPDCTREQFKKNRPTLNDIVTLAISLCRLGYTRIVRSIYNNYRIEDIQELPPNDYGNFVSDLLTAVSAEHRPQGGEPR